MNYKEFEKDWRNMGQVDYLFHKKIRLMKYENSLGDHEHCEFCFEKISTIPGTLHEGYCTIDTPYKYWICSNCYNDFKSIFKWEIVRE